MCSFHTFGNSLNFEITIMNACLKFRHKRLLPYSCIRQFPEYLISSSLFIPLKSNNDIEQKAALVVFQPPEPESIKIT